MSLPAGISLEQAQAKLTTWLAADDKIAAGQSYTIGGRTLTRANSKEVRENIDYWNNLVQKITRSNSRGGIRVRGGVPSID